MIAAFLAAQINRKKRAQKQQEKERLLKVERNSKNTTVTPKKSMFLFY